MSDDLKKWSFIPGVRGVETSDFLDKDVFDNFPRIFISSSDSCVPSDCKSYGCSTILGNVLGYLINNYGWCRQ
jgi:hypothetical protein